MHDLKTKTSDSATLFDMVLTGINLTSVKLLPYTFVETCLTP